MISAVWEITFAQVCPGKAIYPWRDLKALYDLPGRYYHDSKHIERVIAASQQHHIIGPHARMALFLHDVMDSPLGKNSVRFSAEFAYVLTGSEYVADLIMATDHEGEPENASARAVQECDLRQLADPDFAEQSENVRKEYAPFVTPYAFYHGRKAILSKFWNRASLGKLFTSPGFVDYCYYNQKAAINLAEEIVRIDKILDTIDDKTSWKSICG